HFELARTLDESVATHLASISQFVAAQWPLSVVALVGGWRAVARGGAFERALVAWFAADAIMLSALKPLWAHHLIVLVSPLGLPAGTALRRSQERSAPVVTTAAGRRSAPLDPPSASGLGEQHEARHVARLATVALLSACAIIYLGIGIS